MADKALRTDYIKKFNAAFTHCPLLCRIDHNNLANLICNNITTLKVHHNIGLGPSSIDPNDTKLKEIKRDDKEGGFTASNKNTRRTEARRREARKKAKALEESSKNLREIEEKDGGDTAKEVVDPEMQRQKKGKTLKKLEQLQELKGKKERGVALLPEQLAKVTKPDELIRELGLLGFKTEGLPKQSCPICSTIATAVFGWEDVGLDDISLEKWQGFLDRTDCATCQQVVEYFPKRIEGHK